jgi:hypothetical protein
MTALAKQYTKEIYSQRGYWATWEPSVHLSLGTCGPVVKGVFIPEGQLSDFHIAFSTEYDPLPSDTDYSSRKGLKITFQTKAGANAIPNIPQGSAGMRVSFSRRQAVVVAVKGGREHRISNQHQLRGQLLESADKPNGIPQKWFVVTHLVECASASVVVAQGSNAEFTVSAQADLAAGIIDLANAQLGFTIQTENHIGYRMLAAQGATPLFRGLRLKQDWLGNKKIETFGPGITKQQLQDAFEEITPESTTGE